MIEAGIKLGLEKEIATKLALQTVKGTAMLLQKTRLTTQQLIEVISTPGGATTAGRQILENSDVKDVFMKTMQRATARSKELGKTIPW